jgi:hypothetical protein
VCLYISCGHVETAGTLLQDSQVLENQQIVIRSFSRTVKDEDYFVAVTVES